MELSDSLYMTFYQHVTWYEMGKLSKTTVYFVHIDLVIRIGGGGEEVVIGLIKYENVSRSVMSDALQPHGE